MEVILPSHTSDFDFNSANSSPHVNTPKLSGEYYFSAPTSPSHFSQFYKDIDDLLVAASGGAGGKSPKSSSSPMIPIEDEFAFDVSEEWETASQLSAEELFDGGVIKPLNLPTKFQGAFSPRGKYSKGTDLPAVATRKATAGIGISHRGRSERAVNASKSSSRRAARSLSPIRDSEYQYWEDDKDKQQYNSNGAKINSSMICSSKGSKKWSLKDLFLFRSASEGRAAEKDHLKKYTAAYRRPSFRAIDSSGQRKGPVSAHELHYTVNRAVSQDMKKKTFLPYKQGILGRLAFNPAVHALANGFGFSRK